MQNNCSGIDTMRSSYGEQNRDGDRLAILLLFRTGATRGHVMNASAARCRRRQYGCAFTILPIVYVFPDQLDLARLQTCISAYDRSQYMTRYQTIVD